MPVEEEESLRDTISSAFKGESDGVESSPAESDSQAAAPKSASPAVEDNKSRERQAAPAASSNATAGRAAATNGAAAAAAGDKKIDPPVRWTKEEKEEFYSLDPKVQEILLKRNKGMEAHYTKGQMQIAQERQRFAGIEKQLAPRRDQWSKEGVSDDQAIARLFGYYDQSQKDPYAFISQFVQERGLDLARLIPAHLRQQPQQGNGQPAGQPQPQGQPQLHPVVARELQSLRQQIGGVVNNLNGRAEAENRTIASQATNEIDAFRGSTDEHGQALYPFFNEVAADMSRLMSSGHAATLKEAYSKACRLNDDVDARMRENDEIKRKRETEERRAADADRSRRASVSLTSSTSGATHSSAGVDDDDKDDSIRGLLKKSFAAARAESRIS